MVEAVELVACHVFTLAEGEGQRVSMELLRHRMARLAVHSPGNCQWCVAAATVSTADVDPVIKGWQWQTTLNRVRALR